jgi:tetratricopeptide (TPR) repeat protein
MKPIFAPFYVVFLFTCACASKLTLQSEPSDAEVSISVAGKVDKAKAGKTPVELTENQLQQMLQVTPDKAALLEITIEKKDFETRTILFPSNRWGELSKTIKIQLTPRTEASDTVRVMLRHLFNGKKFAESRQYDQAQMELDKALALDSKLAQAMSMKAGVYYLQNNFVEAETWYKKALEAEPSFSEAIQMLEKLKNKKGGGSQP